MMRRFCIFVILFTTTIFQLVFGINALATEFNKHCLAIMPEDGAAFTRIAADMLIIQLAPQPGIDLVERVEIDRIMSEHQLNAIQSMDRAGRMALGKLLRAAGMVFVKYDSTRNRLSMRLVDTNHGFQVAHFQYNLNADALDTHAFLMAEDVLNALNKLRVKPADAQLVSIMRIGNATMLAEYDWLEDELPVILSTCLAKEPQVLMLERRQMWELREEARLHAELRAFAGAGVMIDGELAVSLDVEIVGRDMPMTLTLRLRDADLRELDRVRIEGRSCEIETMVAAAVQQVLLKLQVLNRQTASDMPVLESTELLDIARRHGLVWAAESGYALDATNVAVPEELVKNLVNEAVSDVNNTYLLANIKNSELLERVVKLARAEKICRDAGVQWLDHVANQDAVNIANMLKHPQTMLDAEMRGMLKPVRRALRAGLENRGERKSRIFDPLIRLSPAFFDNPLDGLSYSYSLFDRLESENITPKDRIQYQIMIMHQSYWTAEQYEKLLDHPNALIRYFAKVKLARFSYGEKRWQYNKEAIGEIPAALAEEHGNGVIHMQSFITSRKNYFHDSITHLTNDCSNEIACISQSVHAKLERDLNNEDYRAIVFFQPGKYAELIGPERAIPWIDRLLARRTEILNAVGRSRWLERIVNEELDSLIEYRAAQLHVFDNASGETNVMSHIVISAQAREWQDVCMMFQAVGAGAGKKLNVTPQRLLVDGDAVWVAIAGGDKYIHATGLMKVDVDTGKILAGRCGVISNQVFRGGGPVLYKKDGSGSCTITVRPLFVWKEYVGFAQNGVGVLLFPRNMSSMQKGLSDVIVINIAEKILGQSLMVGNACAIENTFYIVANDNIFSFDLSDGKVKVIGDARRDIDGFAVAGKETSIADLMVDCSGRGLIAVVHHWVQTSTQSKRSDGHSVWSFTPADGSWVCISNLPQSYIAGNLLARDIRTLDRQAYNVLPESFMKTHDVCDFQKGTLAITGVDHDDWQLMYFTHAIAGTSPELPGGFDGGNVQDGMLEKAHVGQFRAAIEADDLGRVQELARQLDVNSDTADSSAPLRWAVSYNRPAIVGWLIGQNVEIDNVGEKTGRTPLMLAAQFGHLPMVKLLLDAGANPAAKDKRGNPLFVIAARAPDPSVLAWCYEQQRPSSGVLNRALFNAVGWNRIHNAKWLLQNGAELHPRDFVRGIVFHACRYASPEMLALLLENGADLNAPNKYGETPLIHAATYNRVDNMQFLFDHGVDLEETYNIQTKSMSLLAILRENLIPDKSEARAVVWKELGKLILRKFGDE